MENTLVHFPAYIDQNIKSDQDSRCGNENYVHTAQGNPFVKKIEVAVESILQAADYRSSCALIFYFVEYALQRVITDQ